MKIINDFKHMIIKNKKLVWDDKFSVDVAEIDNQHKQLVDTINELLDTINNHSASEKIESIVKTIIKYKEIHFETEEKYFKEFNYEEADEHIKEHRKFGEKISEIGNNYKNDPVGLVFELVDFLEDWLIDHLMNVDQKYKECFKKHGLK